MKTVHINTKCRTCKEDMDKILLEKIAVLEKALELLKDKNNYYNFVDERTEIIDVDFAILKAKEMMKSE